MSKRMYLSCLRCKKSYDYSMPTFEEMEYTKYSYCEECLRAGLKLLRDQDNGNIEPTFIQNGDNNIHINHVEVLNI